MFTRSRTQGMRLPFAVTTRPASSAHRVRWRVRPGKPFRVEQRNVAAFYRDRLMHIQHAIRDVGDIDEQRNRAGIRRVSRRNNGRRQRYGLWARRILRMHRCGERNRKGSEKRRCASTTEKRMCHKDSPELQTILYTFCGPNSLSPPRLPGVRRHSARITGKRGSCRRKTRWQKLCRRRKLHACQHIRTQSPRQFP